MRAFLVNCGQRLRRFLQNVPNFFCQQLPSAFTNAGHAISSMVWRLDSKLPSPVGDGPHRPQMVHLKTKEECRLGNETIQVWTVELPSRHAEGILKVIKDHIPGQDAIDLQHLRRFAKPRYLPQHVLGERDLIKELYTVPRAWDTAPATVMQTPNAKWEWSLPVRATSRSFNRAPTLYLLVCPSNIISLQDLHDLMLEHPPFCSSADSWAFPLQIKEVTVPLLAPTSPEQAAGWSEDYWPTFYRKTNPFGAHPASIEKAERELQHPVDHHSISIERGMELAERAGCATELKGFGIGTGCCIVERVDDKTQVIAVAGDARSKPLPSEIGPDATDDGTDDANNIDTSTCSSTGEPKTHCQRKNARKKKNMKMKKKALQHGGAFGKNGEQNGCSSGNIMAHAVMRAIGMVGRKRLRVASQPISSAAAKAESNFAAVGLAHDERARDAFFLDLPITPIEQQYFDQDNLKPDGYLCLKLEIFLTHEPCMMCSMALVHSRVGRVIFKHRMPKTGGLTAEMVSNDSGPVGLGYGLCWRKELNWQFMCWEYTAVNRQAGEKQKKGNDNDNNDNHQADDNLKSSSLMTSKNANGGKLSFASIHV